jgi:hypothetical protein
MADPVGTVAAPVRGGSAWSSTTGPRVVQQWLDDHPQDQHGVHRYTAADFGLDPTACAPLRLLHRRFL